MAYFYYFATIVSSLLAISLFIFISFQAPSKEQKVLQFLATCVLFHNLGDTVSAVTSSPEAGIAGLKISYFGGSFSCFGFILLLGLLTHVNIRSWVKTAVIAVNMSFVVLAVIGRTFPFMYTEFIYEICPGFQANIRHVEYGPGFIAFGLWNMTEMVGTFVLLTVCAVKKKFVFLNMKKCFIAFFIAGAFSMLTFLISFFFKTPYDFSPLGMSLGLLILLFVIYKFRAFPLQQNSEDLVLDNMEDILLAYDSSNHMVYANKRCLDIYDPLRSHLIYGIHLMGFDAGIDSFMAMESGELKTIDGRSYMCDILEISEGGVVKGYVRWLKDVTKEQEYVKEATRLKEEAELANMAKGRFLANMSHEIRTPMNAVIGMDELILRETTENNIREYADNIMRGGKTLLSIINDILDFSKIEAGKMELVEADYSLPLMIKDICMMVETRANDKGLSFIKDIDETLPAKLHGDEVRVKQIVVNMLTNAVKYTKQGSVSFTVKGEKTEGGIKLLFDVKDTGIGIKKEDMSKLFESFERIENADNHKTEGTGLGMSISTSLLKMMGGSLNVDSVYGEGSCFHIVIPQGIVGSETVGSVGGSKEETYIPGNRIKFVAPGTRILIVDDTTMNLTVAKAFLKGTEIEVDTATGGYECLDMVHKKHYDLLFIDNRMPDISGVETLKLLLQDSTNMCRGVPAVAMTADSGEGAKDYFVDAGFTDYISKPMNVAEYEAMVRRLLPEGTVRIVGQ